MIRALLELQNAPSDRAAQFRCSSCTQSIKTLRRCEETRLDFTEKDGPFWPIQIQKGGDLYGFCPGKATWDSRAAVMYKALVVCERTGAHWQEGGIADQPDWWIDLISEFLPAMDDSRFYSRARAILGESKQGSVKDGNNKTATRVHNQGKR